MANNASHRSPPSCSEAAIHAASAKERASLSVEQLWAIIDKQSEVIDVQRQRIAVLEEYLRLERARRFGPSSERQCQSDPAQGELDFGQTDNPLADDIAAKTAALEALNDRQDAETSGRKKRGRKGLSKDLPRHPIRYALSEEEKAGALHTYYTVVKEELDIRPAQVRVIEYLQEKAVFLDDNADPRMTSKRRVVNAPMPKHPLNKCIASVCLLAYIIVAKFCDGLSLYGLEKTLKRYGGDISRTSLANWVIRLGGKLALLVELLQAYQRAYDYIQMDETRVRVLKEKNTSPQSHKWMWVAKGGPPHQPAMTFHYDPSRSAEVPARLLKGFRGYIQCDGLSSYDKLCSLAGFKHLGCFDHARRKFKDAVKAQAKNKAEPEKLTVAEEALGKINALYRLERHIKHAPPYEKTQQRQKMAVPLLAELHQWLEMKKPRTAKGSLTYKAIYYALNQWEKLVRYCEEGRLNISNAGAENAIRPFALGRRRWLFCDTPEGARASAVHFSLVETAKANDLNPEEYYRYILPRIAYAKTPEDWEALLPWNVKEALKKNTHEK